MLEENPEVLESHFLEFSERVLDFPDEVFKLTTHDINSLVLIYKKPQETFTKDLGYFVMQRSSYQTEGIRNEGRGQKE